MALVEQGQCKINSLNKQGLGVGQTEKGKVLLPYTLPGEVVSFDRHAYRSASNCVLKEIIEPSKERATPPCPYFGACGGCLLQHLNVKDYYDFKYDGLKNMLFSEGIEAVIHPVITIPAGERRRANLEAIKKEDQIYLGFHRFHSKQIINIDACLALLPRLSHLLVPIKEVLHKILDNREKAHIFLTEASNGTDITITIQERATLTQAHRAYLEEFALKHSITRLIFRYRKRIDTIREIAKPHILFDGIEVEIDANSFLQSSFKSDEVLGNLVMKYFTNENLKGEHIVDLFCGRGTYTLPLSKYYNVDGFESDQPALTALENAAKKANRPISVTKQDLFESPVKTGELNKYNAAVINPPRAGGQAQIDQLKSSIVEKICYISCNPETFARDAKILLSGGYELVEITPVDQFYWSPHLEVVGFFKRN